MSDNNDNEMKTGQLEALGASVVEAVKPLLVETADGIPYAIYPEGWDVRSMEDICGNHEPRYRQGTAELYDIPSLVGYVKRFADGGAPVYYVDVETYTITAILDDGEFCESTPRRVDRAFVRVKLDPRFTAWKELCAKPVGKRELIRFIEMNDSHFHEPAGAQMRSLASQLEVSKTMNFTDIERTNGAARDVVLRYETQTKELNEIKFPSDITIKIPIFRHQAKAEITVRLHYDLKDGELLFTIRVPDEAAIVEAAWEQVRSVLEHANSLDVPVLNGRPPAPPQS